MQFYRLLPQNIGRLGPDSRFVQTEKGGRRLEFLHLLANADPDPIMSEIYYYAVRNDLKEAIEEMGLTGARFRPCKITAGEYFGDDFSFFENRVFFELQVVGIARFDDLGHDDERYLVASERALRLIHSFSPEELQVLEC